MLNFRSLYERKRTCMDICVESAAGHHAPKPGVESAYEDVLRLLDAANAPDGCQICQRYALQPLHGQHPESSSNWLGVQRPRAIAAVGADGPIMGVARSSTSLVTEIRCRGVYDGCQTYETHALQQLHGQHPVSSEVQHDLQAPPQQPCLGEPCPQLPGNAWHLHRSPQGGLIMSEETACPVSGRGLTTCGVQSLSLDVWNPRSSTGQAHATGEGFA